jgi:hypothetical protein
MKIKAFICGITFVLFFVAQAQAQEPLAKAFIEAVRGNNPALLKQWFPTPALVRAIEPTRTKRMTDAAIRQKYLAPLQKKLANDFANFHASAQQSSIDVSKLRYDSFQLHRDDTNAPNKPLACSINYSYGDKQGTFTITVLEKQKQWTLFEVLLSVNIFDKLK